MNTNSISNVTQILQVSSSGKSGSNNINSQNNAFASLMDRNMNVGKKETVSNTVKTTDVSTSASNGPKIEMSPAEVTEVSVGDKVQNALNQITDAVKEQFDLTDEELEQIMAEMGITAMDLLSPNMLIQFVLQVNDVSDVSEVLTNETLSNMLTDMNETLTEVLEEVQLTEEMINQVVSLKEQPKSENVSLMNSDNEVGDEESDVKIQELIVKKDVANTSNNTELSNNDQTTSQDRDESHTEDVKSSNMETIINGLSSSMEQKVDSFGEKITQIEDVREIVNQVVESIKVNIKADSTSMELMLNPEHLGKVNLNVAAKEGILTAQIAVENELTKQVLENQIQILKDSLNNQGLKVEAVEVTIADMSFNSSNGASSSDSGKESKGNRRKITLEESEAMELGNVDDELINETIPELGRSVNYTA